MKTADVRGLFSVIVDIEPQPCNQQFLKRLKQDIGVKLFFVEGSFLFQICTSVTMRLSGADRVIYLERKSTNKLSYVVVEHI